MLVETHGNPCVASMQDNLYPSEIDDLVSQAMRTSDDETYEPRESTLAEKLLAATFERSVDSTAECPFVDEARAEVQYVAPIFCKSFRIVSHSSFG